VAFETVPWAVGAGAELDAAVARAFVNAATQDTEGVNLPGNFKVSALATPGMAVSITGGGMTLRNRQRPGESYIGVAHSATQVPIAANSSGAIRRDLIVARVIDPDFSPWQPYTDPDAILNGPYFEPFVVSGVGAGVTTAEGAGITYTAVPLARIDQPSGATSITSAMIVDLRRLARPRTDSDSDVQKGTIAEERIEVTETNWHDWPTNSLQTTVPYWATHAQVSIALNNVSVGKVAADFDSRAYLGGLTGGGVAFDYNGSDWSPVGYVETRPHTIYAEFDVRSLQGQTVTCKPQARRIWTENTGDLYFTNREQVVFDLRYFERAV
jgi:hypothetical protein